MGIHYALIDNCSGYVWGDTTADSPEEACRKVHADISGEHLNFEAKSQPDFANENGYHVYDATDFDLNSVGDGNGQSKALVDAVAALPKIGYFVQTYNEETTEFEFI